MCRWKVGVRLSKVTSPDFAVFSNNARCMFRGETGTLSIMRRVAPMRAAHLARFQIRKSLKSKCNAGWIASIHPELAFLRLLFCFFPSSSPLSFDHRLSFLGVEGSQSPIYQIPKGASLTPASPAKAGWLQNESLRTMRSE